MKASALSVHELREQIDIINRELILNWSVLKVKLDETALLRRARTDLEQSKLELEKELLPLERSLTRILVKYPELLDISSAELHAMFGKRIAII